MRRRFKILTALLFALPFITNAQVRTEQTFEKGWKFTRDDNPEFSREVYNDVNGNRLQYPTTGLFMALSA